MEKWQKLLAQIEIFGDERDTLTEEYLLNFEKETNRTLPADYKKFCQVFGAGRLGDFLNIYCPPHNQQFYLETIKYEATQSYVPLEKLEKSMKVEAIVNLVEGGFVLGDDSGSYIVFFDLRSYKESDNKCDIYWARCPDFEGEIYRIGRDFFEFICDFCLGTKSYEILPLSMCPLPSLLAHTFTRYPSQPEMNTQEVTDFLPKNEEFSIEIKRLSDELKTKLKQVDQVKSEQLNFEQLINLSSSNIEDKLKAPIIEELKAVGLTSYQEETNLFSCPLEEFIPKINEIMLSASTPKSKKFIEDYEHLHLPPEYVHDHTRSEQLSDGEDTELTLKALQDKNPYAFFRYIKTLRGHCNSVYSITFTPDGKTLISGDADGFIKLWDLSTYQHISTLRGHTDAVISLVTSSDGQMLISGSADTTIKLWNLNTGQIIHTLTGHSHSLVCLAINADGTYLVSGSADTSIKVWDLNNYQIIHTLNGHSHTVLDVAISANGKTLASASADTRIILWDLNSGKKIKTLEANSGLVFGVWFHPSEQMLVSIHDGDKTIKFWSLQTGEVLRTIPTNVEIISAAISSDWEILAGGGGDTSYSIGLWDLKAGKGITYFSGMREFEHQGCVYAVDFNPQIKMLATGSEDFTIKLWGFPPNININ